ncbi:hypothetical protein KBD45_00125 [Candidatus Dojkabacteria bacterium]|nr:hypothetical protein [Candidatus Dojkabacteria bacterium]
MPYVQNINRDAKLKSGPVSKYSEEVKEAQEKDRKNNEEALKMRYEQEKLRQEQKGRDNEAYERIRVYKERKRNKVNKAIGSRYFGSRSNLQLSGTMKAKIGRHEGGSTAKG